MKPLLHLGALVLVLGSAAGCSNDSTTSPSTTTSTTTTLTFGSALAVGGSTSRAFSMSTAGTIKVTLTAFGSSGQVAGLGLGVPVATLGSPCALTRSVVTPAGGSPQIVADADAGTYCVQIYDVGNLPADTGFSITIEHP
jgi:hypothetical protein